MKNTFYHLCLDSSDPSYTLSRVYNCFQYVTGLCFWATHTETRVCYALNTQPILPFPPPMQKLSLNKLPQRNTPLPSSLSPQSNPSIHKKIDAPFILNCLAAHRPQTHPTSSPSNSCHEWFFVKKGKNVFFLFFSFFFHHIHILWIYNYNGCF